MKDIAYLAISGGNLEKSKTRKIKTFLFSRYLITQPYLTLTRTFRLFQIAYLVYPIFPDNFPILPIQMHVSGVQEEFSIESLRIDDVPVHPVDHHDRQQFVQCEFP